MNECTNFGWATHLQEKRPVEIFQKRGLNKLVDIEEIAGRSWQDWKKNSFILADRDGKTS